MVPLKINATFQYHKKDFVRFRVFLHSLCIEPEISERWLSVWDAEESRNGPVVISCHQSTQKSPLRNRHLRKLGAARTDESDQ